MCVCHRKRFSEIQEIVEKENMQSLNKLIKAGVCGGGCGMCHPYIEKMLVTGETEFYPGDIYIGLKPCFFIWNRIP